MIDMLMQSEHTIAGASTMAIDKLARAEWNPRLPLNVARQKDVICRYLTLRKLSRSSGSKCHLKRSQKLIHQYPTAQPVA